MTDQTPSSDTSTHQNLSIDGVSSPNFDGENHYTPAVEFKAGNGS